MTYSEIINAFRNGRYDEVIDAAEQYTGFDFRCLGMISALANGDYERGIGIALAEEFNRADYYLIRARLHRALGDWKDAIYCYRLTNISHLPSDPRCNVDTEVIKKEILEVREEIDNDVEYEDNMGIKLVYKNRNIGIIRDATIKIDSIMDVITDIYSSTQITLPKNDQQFSQIEVSKPGKVGKKIESEEKIVSRRRDVRIAVVMPVKGREQLLIKTIRRLYKQTLPIYAIICIGDTDAERDVVENAGGIFIYHDNDPLGKKWQYGVYKARELGATDILILGSSDWISDRWCEVMIEKVLDGYDMVGRRDIYFIDIDKGNRKKLLYWPGYHTEGRVEEPIGAGRLISNEILEKIEWKIFDENLNYSLDYSTYKCVLTGGGKIKNITSEDEICALSISCYKWINKHQWKNQIANPGASYIEYIDDFLDRWFPDAVDLFQEDWEGGKRNESQSNF